MIYRLIILLSIVFVSCKQISQERSKETAKEPESSWELLSQGDSFKGWHIYQNEGGKRADGSLKMEFIHLITKKPRVMEIGA